LADAGLNQNAFFNPIAEHKKAHPLVGCANFNDIKPVYFSIL